MRRYLAFAIAAPLAACQPAMVEQSGGNLTQVAEPQVSDARPAAGDQPSLMPSFVQAVCADCHAVESADLSPNPAAPPFADIANQKGLTAQTLSAFLRDAHNFPEAMDFYLDAEEVDALTKYMLTLREEKYEPKI